MPSFFKAPWVATIVRDPKFANIINPAHCAIQRGHSCGYISRDTLCCAVRCVCVRVQCRLCKGVAQPKQIQWSSCVLRTRHLFLYCNFREGTRIQIFHPLRSPLPQLWDSLPGLSKMPLRPATRGKCRESNFVAQATLIFCPA